MTSYKPFDNILLPHLVLECEDNDNYVSMVFFFVDSAFKMNSFPKKNGRITYTISNKQKGCREACPKLGCMNHIERGFLREDLFKARKYCFFSHTHT